MAEFDYQQAATDARLIIGDFGRSGAFVVQGVSGGFDPITGDTLADTADTAISGLVTPVLMYRNSEIDGTTIIQGDGYVYFSGDSVPVGATLTVNGDTYRAVNIIKLQSLDGVMVYQKIQVRR